MSRVELDSSPPVPASMATVEQAEKILLEAAKQNKAAIVRTAIKGKSFLCLRFCSSHDLRAREPKRRESSILEI